MGNFWESLVKGAIDVAGNLADNFVEGQDLSPEQKRHLYAASVAIKLYGKDIADDSSNTYDDVALAELEDFADDTLLEAGIQPPTIPSFE